MQILRNLLLPGSCGNGSIEYLITSSLSSSSQSSYLYDYLVWFVFYWLKKGGVKCQFHGLGDVKVTITSFTGARAGKLIELKEPIVYRSVEVKGFIKPWFIRKILLLCVFVGFSCSELYQSVQPCIICATDLISKTFSLQRLFGQNPL